MRRIHAYAMGISDITLFPSSFRFKKLSLENSFSGVSQAFSMAGKSVADALQKAESYDKH